MKLFYSPASPFARKVLILAAELGLDSRIELSNTSPSTDESLRAYNPLCKIPTLLTDDGTPLYDSRVICIYLNRLAGAAEPDIASLTLEALGDGISDAAVRRITQERRPARDGQADDIARQTLAIQAGLDRAQASLAPGRFAIGEMALASALGYLDLRLGHEDWRPAHPALADWEAEIAGRASVAQTRPH